LHQKLFHDLFDLFQDPIVVGALHRHAPVLWQDPDNTWSAWLRTKFKTTLGSALLDAVQQVCPDLDANDLTLDIDAGPQPDGAEVVPSDVDEIWLTERTVGGGGIIEVFLSRYGEDPRRFFDLVDAALRPSDYEVVDEQLTLFLEWLADTHDSSVRRQVALLREAHSESHDAYARAFDALLRLLSQRGLFVSHSVVAALGTRILKPGSNASTDQMLHSLISDWQVREEQLGIDIDSRVFAYLHSRDSTLDDALEAFSDDAIETDRRQWRFRALLSVLWPRGYAIRGQRLSAYNPFAKLPDAEHALVRDCIRSGPHIVVITAGDWKRDVTTCLIRDSAVVLRAELGRLSSLRAALIAVTSDPIDTGFLLLHPRVRGVERGAGVVDVTVELAEGVQ
jgi:hypothetical protein